jgi:hypothetical protein
MCNEFATVGIRLSLNWFDLLWKVPSPYQKNHETFHFKLDILLKRGGLEYSQAEILHILSNWLTTRQFFISRLIYLSIRLTNLFNDTGFSINSSIFTNGKTLLNSISLIEKAVIKNTLTCDFISFFINS